MQLAIRMLKILPLAVSPILGAGVVVSGLPDLLQEYKAIIAAAPLESDEF